MILKSIKEASKEIGVGEHYLRTIIKDYKGVEQLEKCVVRINTRTRVDCEEMKKFLLIFNCANNSFECAEEKEEEIVLKPKRKKK
jgi:hypothetical protein